MLFDPGDYQNYTIKAPLSTHFRQATCAEVACPHYLKGWKTRVEVLGESELHFATHSGRKFTRLHVAEGENYLVYEAGQKCFSAARHRVRVDRQELFVVRDGRTVLRKHTRADHWVEDLHEYSDKFQTLKKKG